MSNSLRIHERFAARAHVRRVVSAVYVVAMLFYLGWRLTILNPDSLALSLTYYAAEVLGFVLGLTVIFCSWTYRHRVPAPARQGLSVDLFVPAYREPADLIRRTLVAAKAVTYPHDTWLLDDGRRSELEALAAELGVRYVSREKNTNAKAGNLNFALARSKAEFVAVFDADHAPNPNALDVLLGGFSSDTIAMVQAPQDYFNTDAFPYMNARKTGELWHDQSFFYNIAQPCRDAMNGASCAGTSVVYRRAALDVIGGIPEETVTEDLHTSLKLHKAGYGVVYINEPVAYGIAAVDLGEYYKTRHRWAHGNLHALRLENAAFTPKLSWRQRLSYVSLGLIYLEGWQQLLLFAVPIAALVLGLQPFEISLFNVLVVLAFPLLTLALLQELGCGFSRHWANEVFSMARFPVHIAATAGLLRGKMAWRSSSKAMKGRVEWHLLAPQIAVGLASLAALAIGIVELARHDFAAGPLMHATLALVSRVGAALGLTAGYSSAAPIEWFAPLRQGYTLDLVLVAGTWALFNCARAGAVVWKAVRTAWRSHDDFRFEVPLALTWGAVASRGYARVLATSEDHVSFVAPSTAVAKLGNAARCTLYLPNGSIETDIDVVAVRAGPDGAAHCEARYRWRDAAARERLSRVLHAVDWHRDMRGRAAYFATPLDWLARWLRPGRRSAEPAGPWRAVLVRDADRSGVAPGLAFVRDSRAQRMAEVLLFGGGGKPPTRLRIADSCGRSSTVVTLTGAPTQVITPLGAARLDPAMFARYRLRHVSADASGREEGPARQLVPALPWDVAKEAQ